MAEDKTATRETAWKVASQTLDVQTSAGKSGEKITLKTAGKFLDRDIEIAAPVATVKVADVSGVDTELAYGESTTVPAGMIDTAITISNTTAAGTVEGAAVEVAPTIASTATDGKYSITGSSDVAVSSTTAGYISETVGTMTKGSATIVGTVDQSKLGTDAGSTTTIAPAPAEQTLTVTAGYYPTDRTIKVSGMTDQAASFANVATADTTYAEHKGPVLISGDYLYINAGYTGNQKISLADLVPNEVSVAEAIEAGMLDTVSAYDKDGVKITGSIKAKTSADVTRSGENVTVAAGYYKDGATLEIPVMGTIATVDVTAADGEVVIPADKLNVSEQRVAVTASAADIKANATVNATAGTPEVGAENAGKYTVTVPVTITGTATATTTTTGRAIQGTTSDSCTINDENKSVSIEIAKATHTNVITAEATAATATSTQNVSATDGVSTDGILTTAPAGAYLTLTPTLGTTSGSVQSDAKTTTTAAGYCAADCVTDAVQKTTTVSVTEAQGAAKYIAVFEGAYTLG